MHARGRDEGSGIDPEPAHHVVPHVIRIDAENGLDRGGRKQPCSGSDLALELAGAPAGVAKDQTHIRRRLHGNSL